MAGGCPAPHILNSKNKTFARNIFCFAVFGDFYFSVCTENFVFGVFVFHDFTIFFATGGASRKLEKQENQKRQKQNLRDKQKNKNHQKLQNKKYFADST